MPRHQELGDFLHNARQKEGITQRQLAARMGTTQSRIYRYETGQTKPVRNTMERLAHGLRLSMPERRKLFRLAAYTPIEMVSLHTVYVVHTAHRPLMAFTDEEQANEYRARLGSNAERFTHIDSIPLKG